MAANVSINLDIIENASIASYTAAYTSKQVMDELSSASYLNTTTNASNFLVPVPFRFGVKSISICTFGTVLTLVTFVGQILVFLAFIQDSSLRIVNNYYIISLAIADLLISLFSMPVWTVYHTLEYWPFGDMLCDIWNVLDYVLCDVSIFTILAISIDRYMSVVSPLTHRARVTPQICRRVLVLIWVFTTISYGLFIGLTQKLLRPESDINSNQCGTYYGSKLYFAILIGICSIWGPIGTTTFLYLLTLRIVTKSGSAKCESDESESEIDKNAQKLKAARDKKAAKVIFLLLLTFTVCWLPISSTYILQAVAPHMLADWLLYTVYWVGYVNSTLNPICYAIGNPRIRKGMLAAFRGGKRSKPAFPSALDSHASSTATIKSNI